MHERRGRARISCSSFSRRRFDDGEFNNGQLSFGVTILLLLRARLVVRLPFAVLPCAFRNGRVVAPALSYI